MSNLPEDFVSLLPPKEADTEEPWNGPLYFLFVFDPQKDEIHLEHNEDRPRAEAVTHDEMAPEVVHPSRLNGYVYRIKGGWRITSDDHKPLEDPHVKAKIEAALRGKYPPKPLPKLK